MLLARRVYTEVEAIVSMRLKPDIEFSYICWEEFNPADPLRENPRAVVFGRGRYMGILMDTKPIHDNLWRAEGYYPLDNLEQLFKHIGLTLI